MSRYGSRSCPGYTQAKYLGIFVIVIVTKEIFCSSESRKKFSSVSLQDLDDIVHSSSS